MSLVHSVSVKILPVLNDNYVYLVHDEESGVTAVIDPALAEPVLVELAQQQWRLDYVLNTHHHSDHVGGNLVLKQQTGCAIVGYQDDAHRIPGISIQVTEGSTVPFGRYTIHVLTTPGHTSGHIVYYLPEADLLFCGDTLFVMGCGRLFEGSAEQLWSSLQKLRALPPQTRVYCAHEYTETNARFALSLEPDNRLLQQRYAEIKRLRAQQQPTIPSTIAEERATNPFLRADQVALQQALKMLLHRLCLFLRR
ncbi:hydroxyacylglutathione hydrolase [Methylocucumis oryzae]|uniref:hydroxyacylglutathione hydrolase n=1 Tax=Methylocucumis oryzae TaxID=1632867 RepID=UPI000AC6A10F